MNLYWATSWTFYDGKIKAHPSCENPPSLQVILTKLNKIELKASKDAEWKTISHNCLVPHVKGKKEFVEVSSTNEVEVKVVSASATALVEAGISEKEICLETQY